jgi:hypothetical protein
MEAHPAFQPVGLGSNPKISVFFKGVLWDMLL